MTTTSTTTYEVEYGNDTPYSEQSEWQQQSNPWTLVVRTPNGSRRFSYWTGSAITDDPTPRDILECLISDASLGAQSFDDFCADLGYDTDSRSAYATWQECRRTGEYLAHLGIDADTLDELEGDDDDES